MTRRESLTAPPGDSQRQPWLSIELSIDRPDAAAPRGMRAPAQTSAVPGW